LLGPLPLVTQAPAAVGLLGQTVSGLLPGTTVSAEMKRPMAGS
jgi:hypothetical protein